MKSNLPLQIAVVLTLVTLLSCPLPHSSNDEFNCVADSYEPNDFLRECYHLGAIDEGSPEANFTATIDNLDGGDYFRFHAKEGSHLCAAKEDQHYQVRVRLVSATGKDYDLALYSDGLDLIGSSSSPGDSEESITFSWDGKCVLDDSRSFRIEVSSQASAGDCEHYILYIDMWNR